MHQGYSYARMVRNEDEEGRLRWYRHVMRRGQEYVGKRVMKVHFHHPSPYILEKEKSKIEWPKRRFLDVVKENMGKLVRGRRTLETERCEGASYAVATPD